MQASEATTNASVMPSLEIFKGYEIDQYMPMPLTFSLQTRTCGRVRETHEFRRVSKICWHAAVVLRPK